MKNPYRRKNDENEVACLDLIKWVNFILNDEDELQNMHFNNDIEQLKK